MTDFFDEIGFKYRTKKNLENAELAAEVVRLLLRGPEFLRPKLFGDREPLHGRVNPDNIQPIVDLWMGTPTAYPDPSTRREGLLILEFCREGDFMVHWIKGRQPSFRVPEFDLVSGGIPTGYVKASFDRLEDYLSTVKRLAELIDPAYGLVQNMMTPHWDAVCDLTIRLPDIPWGSIFGTPYIEMWGREKILNAPFHSVEELPSGHIFAQLTESILDPHLPEDRREAVREYFGEEYFMKGSRTYRSYKTGKAPRFD